VIVCDSHSLPYYSHQSTHYPLDFILPIAYIISKRRCHGGICIRCYGTLYMDTDMLLTSNRGRKDITNSRSVEV
jgi:hypothetical protein